MSSKVVDGISISSRYITTESEEDAEAEEGSPCHDNIAITSRYRHNVAMRVPNLKTLKTFHVYLDRQYFP